MISPAIVRTCLEIAGLARARVRARRPVTFRTFRTDASRVRARTRA